MKLTTKLLLAFGATIVLIAAISCLSWYATAKYDKQKDVLLLSESIINDVMATESHVAKAIIDYKPEPIKEAYKRLDSSKQNATQLLGIVTSQENKDHLNNILKSVEGYRPILNTIETLFNDFDKIMADVSKLGNNVQKRFVDLSADEYKTAANIALSAANIRYALMGALYAKTDEAYKHAEDIIAAANKLYDQDNVKNNPMFRQTIEDIRLYLNQVQPLLDSGEKIQDLRVQSNKGGY